MKLQNEWIAWVFSSFSLLVWSLWFAALALFLALAPVMRLRAEEAGGVGPIQWGWLLVFLFAAGVGWFGEVLLWYLLIRYRRRHRPVRTQVIALAAFSVAAAVFAALFTVDDIDNAELTANSFCLVPLMLGGIGAALLPASRTIPPTNQSEHSRAAHEQSGGQP